MSSGNPNASPFEPFRGQLRPRNFTIQPLASRLHGGLKQERTNPENRELQDSVEPRTQNTSPQTPDMLARGHLDHTHARETGTTKDQEPDNVRFRTPDVSLAAQIQRRDQERQSMDGTIRPSSPTGYDVYARLIQSSDCSSAYVRGVKTASMSDFSMSIAPRTRLGQSTATDMGGCSQLRSSLDSDRPVTRGSVDVVASKRGQRRYRIIDEIAATERSYVADLKALVNLYSTLSASTNSATSRITAAIQRNINRILHIHENLLHRLSNMLLQAAARRWADTAGPLHSDSPREPRPQRLKRKEGVRIAKERQCMRSSIDSVAMAPGSPAMSDLLEVRELTTIFKEVVSDLYIYEEYCANYEIIKHELQRQMPQLWSQYESGMESLACAIIPIVGRPAADRRGMTVADLLIKPIQRITKYPLLLGDLLHETPVADAFETHAELDAVLQTVREVVQTINMALDDRCTRLHVQRR